MTGTSGGGTCPVVTTTVPDGYKSTWEITKSTYENLTNGFYIGLSDDASYRLNYRADGTINNSLAFWTGGAGVGSTFTVSQDLPEITLNSIDNTNYYATLYLPFAAQISSTDVKAYTASTLGDGVVNMTELTDGIIPAETGVVLVGTSSTMTSDIAVDPTAQGNSLLSGTLTAITLSDDNRANYLVFGTSNNEVGFFKPSSSNTSIGANRAYLNYSTSSANSMVMNFSGELTAIKSVTTTETDADAPAYDLSGRTVKNPSKGLYIRNGKKIYIK